MQLGGAWFKSEIEIQKIHGFTHLKPLDITLQNKLMKGFSRQLILKHQYVKQIIEEGDLAPLPVDRVKKELDQLINVEQFLNVIGMGPKSIKVKYCEEKIGTNGWL